jgi:hypothetical protein
VMRDIDEPLICVVTPCATLGVDIRKDLCARKPFTPPLS